MPKKSTKVDTEKKITKMGKGFDVDIEYDLKIDEMKKKNSGLYTNTARDVLLLSACLALIKGLEPKELPKEKDKTTHKVASEQIHSDHQFLINLISFYKNRDYSIFIDDNKARNYCEEMANAGFPELEKLFRLSDFPNFELIEMIKKGE